MARWKKELVGSFQVAGHDRPFKPGDAGVLSSVHVRAGVDAKTLRRRVDWAISFVEEHGWTVYRVDERPQDVELHIWRGGAMPDWLTAAAIPPSCRPQTPIVE